MSHIKGDRDSDLHHPDGTHRTTCASTSGDAIEMHERRIRSHLQRHLLISMISPHDPWPALTEPLEEALNAEG